MCARVSNDQCELNTFASIPRSNYIATIHSCMYASWTCNRPFHVQFSDFHLTEFISTNFAGRYQPNAAPERNTFSSYSRARFRLWLHSFKQLHFSEIEPVRLAFHIGWLAIICSRVTLELAYNFFFVRHSVLFTERWIEKEEIYRIDILFGALMSC